MLDFIMVFYLDKILRICKKNFLQNGLKNILFVLLVSLSDVAVFLLIGFFLSGMDNISFASAMIVCLFVVICVLFFAHRLLLTQLHSLYDKSVMDCYKSAEPTQINKLYWFVISGHRNAALGSVFASINIMVSIVCLFFMNFFAAIFALLIMAVFFYTAGRHIPKAESACQSYIGMLNEANMDDNSSVEFNNADKIVCQSGKFCEVTGETKSLLKIICIVGWAVCCLLPIVEQLTLQQYIPVGIMFLYIISQSFVMSRTYDDIIITRYCINQIQQH